MDKNEPRPIRELYPQLSGPLQALQQLIPSVASSPHRKEYERRLQSDIHTLQDIQRGETARIRLQIPSAPYREPITAAAAGHKLFSVMLSSINMEPEPFYMAHKVFTAFGIELPHGVTIGEFLEGEDKKSHDVSSAQWTFSADENNFPNVFLDVTHIFPKAGDSMSSRTIFRLAFEPEVEENQDSPYSSS